MPQQRNLYPYVSNMPLALTDPLGLFTGCKLQTKYPVKTEKLLVSKDEETHYQFLNARTTGLSELAPVPLFWIICEWWKITNITEVFQKVVTWSYVYKCYEECKPPVVKAIDVIKYGPMVTEFSRKMRVVTKQLEEAHDIVTESPRFKLKWEVMCKEAGPPSD